MHLHHAPRTRRTTCPVCGKHIHWAGKPPALLASGCLACQAAAAVLVALFEVMAATE